MQIRPDLKSKRMKIAVRMLAPLLAFVLLSGFSRFTPITTVCPTCAEKGDKLTFPDGKTLIADVVAKNMDGYIVSKYGELRFIQFKEIAKIDFAAGSEPKGLDGYDQILINNGTQTVLNGTLVQVEPGKPVILRNAKQVLYTVMPKQVLLYYQRGMRRAAPAAEKPPEAEIAPVAPAAPPPPAVAPPTPPPEEKKPAGKGKKGKKK